MQKSAKKTALYSAHQNMYQNSSMFYLKRNRVQTKNLISFMPDSWQRNNADVNPSNLDMKQNSSRIVDWLFQFDEISSGIICNNSFVASLYQSKKKLTHFVGFKNHTNILWAWS